MIYSFCAAYSRPYVVLLHVPQHLPMLQGRSWYMEATLQFHVTTLHKHFLACIRVIPVTM